MKQIVFMFRIRLKSALQPGKYNVHQQTNAVIIMETLFVFLKVQLKISPRKGNLQMLLDIELFKKKETNKQSKTKVYSNSYFYNKRCNVALMAPFIIFLII